MACLLSRQLLAGPQQGPQFLECLVRDKAAADQAARHQIGDPGGVVDVGPPGQVPEGMLAAGDIFDVRGIRNQQLEVAVAQDVPHRLPVNPGRLHCHMAAS